jgi:Flp pilus assembly protein TadG
MSRAHRVRQRGSTLIEFTLVCLLVMVIIFAGIEFDRMVLVYTTMANSARAGVRYAIVHGVDNPASTDQVKTVVQNFASAGALNTSQLTVTVSYPDTTSSRANCAGGTNPGCLVSVVVQYPYDPFTALPVGVNLSSTSKGIISI